MGEAAVAMLWMGLALMEHRVWTNCFGAPGDGKRASPKRERAGITCKSSGMHGLCKDPAHQAARARCMPSQAEDRDRQHLMFGTLTDQNENDLEVT
jgi:hypothetical protein